MLGDFLTRILILLLGYAYPGFECYKTVEKNRVEIDELRFWCQYWIIVAILTVVEKFTDIFISWLPMYGEMKLVLIIYLWYPKTKGTAYIYQTVLRPLVARHENDIDRKLLEWKARAWDLFMFYWQNCTHMGHNAFFQVMEYLASQSRFSAYGITKKIDGENENAPQWPSKQSSLSEEKQSNLSFKNRKQPPSPPPSPGTLINRSISLTPKARTGRLHLDSRTEYLQQEEGTDSQPVNKHDMSSPRTPRPRAQDQEGQMKDSINLARARLRRLNTAN